MSILLFGHFHFFLFGCRFHSTGVSGATVRDTPFFLLILYLMPDLLGWYLGSQFHMTRIQ